MSDNENSSQNGVTESQPEPKAGYTYDPDMLKTLNMLLDKVKTTDSNISI